MRTTTRLKQLIAAPEILVMPGVHDALGARLAEGAGFEAITAGGYGATATLLGRPDSSQLSLTELSEMYSRLCDATTLPLLADADTGFGNVTNVARAVRLYEKAGVAGLFIEDRHDRDFSSSDDRVRRIQRAGGIVSPARSRVRHAAFRGNARGRQPKKVRS